MQPAKMETKRTIWYSCNQEIQSQDNDNNNNNNSNEMNNDSNNNAHVHNADAQVTFNHSKATELRQTRLQRQHEQQHNSPPPLTPASPISASSSSTQSAPPPLSGVGEKLRSSAAPHRLPRRKRLQRQKPTELDDADFAYAADLEEEDEEEELVVVTQPPPSVRFNTTSLIGGPPRGTELHSTPSSYVTEKRLHHFQQQHHSTPFDGQPSSLPNCFASAATVSIFHHHHHHHQREHRLKHEESFDSSTTTTTNTTDTATSPASPLLRRHNFTMLKRDNSTHSESSSRYSSVDSLLEARKPDPEAILINLGFGPVGSEDILSRIPKRFLKPSQVRGIDTEAFIRRLQLANNLADHSVLGYRGLTGNPDIPPSRIVAKIMHRFEVNERKKSMGSIEQTI